MNRLKDFIMIKNKRDLYMYIYNDSLRFSHVRKKTRSFGDEIWKYIINLRKYEYYLNCKRNSIIFY